MRLELPDGQWAELRERISHGSDKRIKLAHRRGRDDDAAALEIDDILVREFVTAWHVLDIDGTPVPLADADATDRAREDVIDTIALRAAEMYVEATVPNAPTPD